MFGGFIIGGAVFTFNLGDLRELGIWLLIGQAVLMFVSFYFAVRPPSFSSKAARVTLLCAYAALAGIFLNPLMLFVGGFCYSTDGVYYAGDYTPNGSIYVCIPQWP